ncbi:primosomal protein N' [Corynebacterium sp. NML130628]|uniref:primosomal protein N' n=1 Tax=Corynebacterium sp. NML130628 TaxID=1906333 RepID=UPI0008FB688C|nr:primosomal protein N' [Corynebacterium sp. NML130628]OIR45582.1 primosome assembly protein PriA [Corynebacterium sp. NML130628]
MSKQPASTLPIAKVLPQLGLVQLDRTFDYYVAEEQSEDAKPGTRVRVRFAGRLVDGLVLDRTDAPEHAGSLRYLERVISPEIVAPIQLRQLVDALAERYAGVRSDIYRSAIPPRHKKAEETDTSTPWGELGETTEPDLSAWSTYQFGESFVDAVLAGKLVRAAWQVAPDTSWAEAVAALVAKVALDGGGALVVVPDQRDVDSLEAELKQVVGPRQISTLTSALGPQARYSRYLSALHGQARIVVGTRSAAFAPVQNLQLLVLMDDGNDNLVDPREPYVHAREVLTTRSALEHVSLIIGGVARTAETQMLVESGWMHGLEASKTTIRERMPRIYAAGDSDYALERDPRARQARLPSVAFQSANRALERDRPVLFQVPRAGYIRALACGECRTPSRCRSCNGPLELPQSGDASAPTCRWCGRIDPSFRCAACGSRKLRAVVLGTDRTAEELGRAFPQVRVRNSSGEKILAEVEPRAQLVVATPGAEPFVQGGYGAAVLMDPWALLQRPDLRAAEETFSKWIAAAALVEPHTRGGEVVVTADPAIAVVQFFLRWDPSGYAELELEHRREVSFPPTAHVAVVDAPRVALEDYFANVSLPPNTELLGPVDLPSGVTLPGTWDQRQYGPAQRMLVRCPVQDRNGLGRALRAGLISRATRKQDLPLRVQVDPLHIG